MHTHGHIVFSLSVYSYIHTDTLFSHSLYMHTYTHEHIVFSLTVYACIHTRHIVFSLSVYWLIAQSLIITFVLTLFVFPPY